MFSIVNSHISRRLTESQIIYDPFPHLYVRNVFPDQIYEQLLKNKPKHSKLPTLQQIGLTTYHQPRKALVLTDDGISKLIGEQHTFWSNFIEWICSEEFKSIVISKFGELITQRFTDKNINFDCTAKYLHDTKGYKLGPHTDRADKVVTLLFYLPDDDSLQQLGTSIYKPKNSNFICEGGPHYDVDRFDLYKTSKFLPNSLFGFFKTNNSFHGVEPVIFNVDRQLISYSILYQSLTRI